MTFPFNYDFFHRLDLPINPFIHTIKEHQSLLTNGEQKEAFLTSNPSKGVLSHHAFTIKQICCNETKER